MRIVKNLDMYESLDLGSQCKSIRCNADSTDVYGFESMMNGTIIKESIGGFSVEKW
jgi:hypothetical protein